ncbi:thymidylate synthase [Lysinibacillus fusiformis]|uniref:thymidylate synthase n=1 Tax=Lysinibacillus fusiformis TaxID=28031 RepID=UPI00263B875A|nr:thymidylate synthase [Lysinibacillus fusiformis]MDC6267216.1 thymidylate synthase [Lysinibacillus sphaericus]MDN4968350.1 thymidylate synthase [Lysinibacillus fusiformis]MDN4968524.1 thymidylate synthase [Lysinibacillus fusiformis]
MQVDLVYKDLVKKVLSNGIKKGDRTNTGTISLFGNQIEIDLQEGFPLLTTKRVYWKGILSETIMFLKGITDLKFLLEKDVDIWTRDAYKKYLKEMSEYSDALTFTLDEFREDAKINGYDLGVIYGSQWVDFNGEGVNQLSYLNEEIKNNPNSRRLKVYSANPSKVHNQTLPPCHDAFQFNVRGEYLDCLFQMRSSDIFHGLPFNIASYALITHIQAKMRGLKVGRLVAQLGDTHIYTTHLDAIKEQLKREPKVLPQLNLSDRISTFESISEIEFEDIELLNYSPHSPIKAPQAF